MKEIYINAFVNAIKGVFTNLGFGEASSENIHKCHSFISKHDLITMIGLSGNLRGNVALAMHYDTAKKIASTMMMGMEITEIDEMCVSALGEMTNMICGQAVMELSGSALSIDITPPTVIYGSNIKATISQIETIVVDISSSLGNFELNLGLEICVEGMLGG